jgi:hypothetical protein
MADAAMAFLEAVWIVRCPKGHGDFVPATDIAFQAGRCGEALATSISLATCAASILSAPPPAVTTADLPLAASLTATEVPAGRRPNQRRIAAGRRAVPADPVDELLEEADRGAISEAFAWLRDMEARIEARLAEAAEALLRCA